MQLRKKTLLGAHEVRRLTDLLGGDECVQVAYLFGSGARGGLRLESDLDIGVASSRGPLPAAVLRALAQHITEATGRPADVVDLASASAPVLRAALAGGRELLCADRALRSALQRRLVYETEDFLPYQRRLLEEKRRRWTGT